MEAFMIAKGFYGKGSITDINVLQETIRFLLRHFPDKKVNFFFFLYRLPGELIEIYRVQKGMLKKKICMNFLLKN